MVIPYPIPEVKGMCSPKWLARRVHMLTSEVNLRSGPQEDKMINFPQEKLNFIKVKRLQRANRTGVTESNQLREQRESMDG